MLARIDTAARLANVTTPRADDFRRIAKLIAAGKSLEAMTELEKFAQTLDAVATAFEKLAADRTDPKIAARQLVHWQDDLATRFRTATASNSANFANLPDTLKRAFRSEQAALRAAVAALKLPPEDGIRSLRDRVQEHLTAVGRYLAGSGVNADTAMKAASEYLTRLADSVPTIPERLGATREKFEYVRQEQDLIQAAAEQALRGTDPTPTLVKKLAALHERQRAQLVTLRRA